MSGFQITITDAGRAALINAQNNGTVAFVLSQVGVSTQHVAANLTGLTQLPNERKRLATMAGDVVADDTLHVTIRDEGDDAYAVRAFGIYTSAGVLFAVYSQPDPILEKSAAAMLLLAVDARLVALGTAMVEFGPADFSLPPASETVAGVVEIATDAEVDAGLDPWRVITARTLKRALSALAGFALIGHKHDAADTTSGVFHVGRIPALDMSKITGLAMALAGKAAEVHTHTINQITGLTEALLGKAAAIHQHAADDIISGVLAVGRIPALGMEKIMGLANALALKANADGANLTGIARIASFFLGTGRAYVYPAGDGLNIRVGPAGVEHYWSFTSQGNMLLNGGPMWHLGNFDPESRVSVAATNLGSTWNVPLTTLSSAAHFAALPTGFSSMITPHSVGTPGGYGYFFKMARRDSNDGWSGLWINHIAALGDAPELYVGTAMVGTALPTWTRAWTAANFDPNTKAPIFNPNFKGISWFATDRPGKINIQGADDRAGVLEFHGAGGRIGFLGYGDGPDGNPYLGSDGARCWVFQTRPSFNGATPWDGNNLRFAGGGDVSNPAVGPHIYDHMISPAALWASARSIGPSGYVQIPGTPIIMQWGVRAATVPEGPVDTYLPIAFGGGCLFASATPRNASGVVTMDFYMQVMGRWQDRISWYANRANGSAGNMSGFEWMAIGLATGNPDPAYYSGGGGGGGGGGGELNPEL